MSENTLWIAIICSTLVAIFLLFYIIKTWSKIKELKKAQDTLQEERQQNAQTTQLKAVESIKLIAQLMIEEQVDLSEGCIRIKILLDHVAPAFHEHSTFGIFSTMYTATEHMPTHEARKNADKKLIRKLDKERLALEAENKEAILMAAKQVIVHEFV